MSSTPWSFDSGRVRIDAAARLLVVNGEPARLGGRAFDLLLALAEQRDRVVPKGELLDRVWPGLVVEENNLQVHVMTLRKLLGAQAIATVSGRGYRFTLVADAAVVAAAGGATAAAAETAGDGLIGREALLATVCAALAPGGTRVITLTGPGGSGKTRLALAATAAVAPVLPDGACAVMLAPLRNSALLTAAVAAALGLQQSSNETPEEQVRTFLRHRRLLLLLDNLEHLPAAATHIAVLLETCPGLRVLATSRARLRLAGEHEIEVPPLALPADDNAAGAAEAPAVRLFAARANEAGCALRTDADWAAAAQVCRRVDGLPLAIELAAARLRMLTPPALAARLQRALPLLTRGATELPARQQTLRGTIAWSHDLLDADVQSLFRRLGVFVGGWSLDAAEAIDTSPADTLDRLEVLLDHHLVQRVDDVDGQPRYAMLETIREFALERCEAAGAKADVQRRHAELMATLLAREEREIRSARRPAALARLAADRNNLRAALAFALQEPAALALAARIVGHSGWWWYFDDALREGEATVAALLPQLSEAAPSGDAVLCWIAAARVAFYSGAPALARERAARAVALLAQAGDTEARAHAQMLLALATNPVSNSDADAWMAQSLDAFTAVGEPWGIALGTQYRGVLLFFAPDAQAESERFLLEGRARFDALGDPWGSGASWLYLGLMAARRGDPDEAERCLQTTLVVSQRAGDAFRTAATLHRLARLSAQRDDLATAQAQARAAATLRLQRGHARDAMLCARWLGYLSWRRGEHDAAARWFGAAALSTGTTPFSLILGPESAAECAQALQVLPGLLGPDRWSTRTAEGEALGLEGLLARDA